MSTDRARMTPLRVTHPRSIQVLSWWWFPCSYPSSDSQLLAGAVSILLNDKRSACCQTDLPQPGSKHRENTLKENATNVSTVDCTAENESHGKQRNQIAVFFWFDACTHANRSRPRVNGCVVTSKSCPLCITLNKNTIINTTAVSLPQPPYHHSGQLFFHNCHITLHTW